MAHDREVAGIRCQEVLAKLSDYLDDDLDTETRGRVEAHLRGCDWCERFGSDMSAMVSAVRKQLADDDDVDEAVNERLMAKLALD